jgi:Glycosyl transferase family 2/Glycosyltransferase family 25 (LPS biosynthesis protein)
LLKCLSIGMATYDDYDGVYFTVMAIRLYHPEVAADTEIIVVDNHPGGSCAEALKGLESWVPGYRYIPFDRVRGTAARDLVFREATGEFVLCMDSHVMLAPGALRQLMDYFQANPGTPDLLQGPLLYDDLRTLSTHMDRTWSTGMYGVWGSDGRAQDPAAPPFEIPMQGLGVFACRKAAWPGFNPRLKGFGGEEGYIQEKFRRAGGRALCLPFLRWLHRFGRPGGVPYENTWEDRIRNYFIIADELGIDPSPAVAHFCAHLGPGIAGRIIQTVQDELASPFHFFDAIYCINLAEETRRWQEVSARFARLGIAHRVRRFEAIRTQPSHHVGCALSHRAVVAEAKRHGLANILVFEDDVVFTSDAIPGLRTALLELRDHDWGMLYLGACRWRQEYPPLEGVTRLAKAGAVTCTHAVAYNQSIYGRIISEVPADPAGMEQWLGIHHGIDQYYAFCVTEGKYLLSPVIATQPNILPLESLEVQQMLV